MCVGVRATDPSRCGWELAPAGACFWSLDEDFLRTLGQISTGTWFVSNWQTFYETLNLDKNCFIRMPAPKSSLFPLVSFVSSNHRPKTSDLKSSPNGDFRLSNLNKILCTLISSRIDHYDHYDHSDHYDHCYTRRLFGVRLCCSINHQLYSELQTSLTGELCQLITLSTKRLTPLILGDAEQMGKSSIHRRSKDDHKNK